MDNSILIIFLISTATILCFTILSVLLMIFSSGGNSKTIAEEATNQYLSMHRIRNKKSANKAADAYLFLQQERSDFKITNDHKKRLVRKTPKANIDTKRRRLTSKQRNKIPVG